MPFQALTNQDHQTPYEQVGQISKLDPESSGKLILDSRSRLGVAGHPTVTVRPDRDDSVVSLKSLEHIAT